MNLYLHYTGLFWLQLALSGFYGVRLSLQMYQSQLSQSLSMLTRNLIRSPTCTGWASPNASRHPLLGWPCFCFLLLCKHVVLLENGPESVVNSKQGDKQSTSLACNIVEIVKHFLKLSRRCIRVFLQVVYGKKVPDLVMREWSRKINGKAHQCLCRHHWFPLLSLWTWPTSGAWSGCLRYCWRSDASASSGNSGPMADVKSKSGLRQTKRRVFSLSPFLPSHTSTDMWLALRTHQHPFSDM